MAPLMTSLFMATVLLAGQVLAQAPTTSGMTASPPDMECPELMAFKEACKVRDTANMDKDEALYYVLKKIIMDINETNIRIDMLEERVNITETHIENLWKETIIINTRIDMLNETINKLICQVYYIEWTQQALTKVTKRISEVVARIDQHGAQCGYRAVFTEAQTVVTYDSIFTNDGVGSMDKDTGKWVAGAAGTYAISMSAYTHLDRRDQNMINLLKNGEDVGKWGEWMFGFVGDDMGGRSLVLKLAAGDELTLKTGAMAVAEGDNTQTDVKDLDFCVFLIYADKPDGIYTKAPVSDPPSVCPLQSLQPAGRN